MAKRQKLEEPENGPKYPFVDYDSWMDIMPVTESPMAPSVLSSTVFQTARPICDWFDMSKVGEPARRSQNSVVAHSPFREDQSVDSKGSLYVTANVWEKYIRTRGLSIDIPACYSDKNFRALMLADVVANMAHRDPTKYVSVWPEDFFGLPTSNPAGLVVLCDLFDMQIYENGWEESNRKRILKSIIDGLKNVSDSGDLIIPFGGLIASVWFAGIIFRLTQLFLKVAIGRSLVNTSIGDDQGFIFCQCKRGKNKFVNRTITLLERLYEGVEKTARVDWGYSVPPVCFTDPAFANWLSRVNQQLVPNGVNAKLEFSVARIATALRIKKYIFASTSRVGFYFGSFDPVHENHIALARYALESLNFDTVVLVPNQDGNDEKENMSPLATRVEMINSRIEKLELESGRIVCEPPVGATHRWESKETFAQKVSEKLFCESPVNPTHALLLGQDSWNKAVLGSSRDKTTRHFIGIAKLNCEVFIFPRAALDSLPVLPAPKPIRDKVTVVDAYSDPIEGLSSSSVRERVQESGVASAVAAGWINESVAEYIEKHSLYKSN
jgi:cytidyltransferase-like protein